MLAQPIHNWVWWGIEFGDKSGVWLHQLASPVMNSREEAGLMCNVASGAGVAYVTRTADLAGRRGGRGFGWEQ